MRLQQLAALNRQVQAEQRRFRDGFSNGEEDFQTYKLIQKAATSLDDAVTYWRISRKHRPHFRGLVFNKEEDDKVLKDRLQTALNAIEELKGINASVSELD